MYKCRMTYIYLAILTIILGLFSRYGFIEFPDFVGNVLWATFIYMLFRILFIDMKKEKVAFIALVFLVFIELTQLYHAPLIDSLRGTILGGIILGYCFHYDDIVSYFIGILIGFLSDKRLF